MSAAPPRMTSSPTAKRGPAQGSPSGARARPAGGVGGTRGLLLGCRLDRKHSMLTLDPPTPLERRSVAEVGSWFSDAWLSPLFPSGLDLPGRLEVSLVVREREGGRRYPFHLPGYEGPRVVGERAYRTASAGRDRVLLSAIPKAQRHAFAAPPGHRYLLADIDRCFPVLLASVADDEALLDAARGDLHQEAGDTLAPHLSANERRWLGKRFNNAVIGLISPAGWHHHLRELGITVTVLEANRMHDRWWERFAAARDFRDAWLDFHRSVAKANQPLRIVYPDGRPFTFDRATVRGVARRPRWERLASPQARLAASARRTFAAIWRGIEGVVLDEVLHRLHALRGEGLRLVLPLYDGVLLQAPESCATQLAEQVRNAFLAAFRVVGIPAGVTITDAPTWGGRCDM